jgi:hypothetical protein
MPRGQAACPAAGVTGLILGRVTVMNQMPSMNRVDDAAGPSGQVRPDDPELGSHEVQPGAAAGGPGPAVTAEDAAREMIAATRRGDQPGAEQALEGYLAHILPAPAAGDPAAAGAALRDLAMKLAEVAAVPG